MSSILTFFNVNTTFFTILGYPMSYIECFGTLFNLACVYLLVRKHILNWPVGLVGVVLFGALFYQLHLYADLFEQIYYFATGLWGWYAWAHARRPADAQEEIVVTRNTPRQNIWWLASIGAGTLAGTYVMTRIHLWLPGLFSEPAALPFLDVLTTIMSFAAQALMIKQRLENWLLWIAVDVIAIGLYWYKGVPFVSLLYVVFLVLACLGLRSWLTTYKKENTDDARTGDRQILPTS